MQPQSRALIALVAIISLVIVQPARIGEDWNRLGQDNDRPRGTIKYTDAAEADRVTSLPGWGPLGHLDLFSGYVTVDKAADRNLFYALVGSETDTDNTQPLLLWLNGGPGCSSIGGGFLSELGPFLPLPGGKKLQPNPYSWHKAGAHVLFVESPAFVGFSYSRDPRDRVVGDSRTAADMRLFLLGLLDRFPHLAARELYISGESYAGHYLPTLAWAIVQGNKAVPSSHLTPGPADGYLNFKGVLLGNPWTDTAIDNLGAVDFWWAHALISDSTALGIKATCDFSRIGPLDAHPSDSNPHTRSGACDKFCNTAAAELGPINIYHIYADVCPPARAVAANAALARALSSPPPRQAPDARAPQGGVAAPQSAPLLPLLGVTAGSVGLGSLSAAQSRVAAGVRGTAARTARDPEDGGDPPAYDPCVDDEVEQYLNQPDVQRALHANLTGELPGSWSDCTRGISYSREDLLESMLPVWRKLIATPGLRFLVYSGDVDGIVPVVGTRRWVAGLGLPEASPWRPWISPAQGQVGGWTISYRLPASPQGGNAGGGGGLFVFATVRGAGHMVPYTEPQRGMHLVSRFLSNTAL